MKVKRKRMERVFLPPTNNIETLDDALSILKDFVMFVLFLNPKLFKDKLYWKF